MKTPTQELIKAFNRRLGKFGQVVLAGGAVRDMLMNRIPKDYDIFVLIGQGPGWDWPELRDEVSFIVGVYFKKILSL